MLEENKPLHLQDKLLTGWIHTCTKCMPNSECYNRNQVLPDQILPIMGKLCKKKCSFLFLANKSATQCCHLLPGASLFQGSVCYAFRDALLRTEQSGQSEPELLLAEYFLFCRPFSENARDQQISSF